jgi:hypothetical protein
VNHADASLADALVAPVNGLGRALIVAQAVLVGLFMLVETAGMRRLSAVAREHRSPAAG